LADKDKIKEFAIQQIILNKRQNQNWRLH